MFINARYKLLQVREQSASSFPQSRQHRVAPLRLANASVGVGAFSQNQQGVF